MSARSDKEQAAPAREKDNGFHSLTEFADGTGEPLAIMLRPGNAGSNTAADHNEGLPVHAGSAAAAHAAGSLVRAASGGGTHEFLDWLTRLRRRGQPS